MRFSRALILLAFACLLAIILINGGVDALLTVLPLAGLVALLLNGRYVGEDLILRHRGVLAPVVRRRSVRLPRPRPTRVRSVYARSVMSRRGPPAVALV